MKDTDYPESLIGFIIVILLLITSALISGSEAAFFSIKADELEEIKKSPDKSSLLTLRLLAKPEQLLSAILVGNSFLNITVVILSLYLLGGVVDFSQHFIFLFVFLIVIACVLLLFTEVIPRTIALHRPKQYAGKISPLIRLLIKITQPLNYFVIGSTALLTRRLNKYKKNLTFEEISKALTSKDEYYEEKEMLEGIAKFGTKTVSEIMRPRMDVTGIEVHCGFDEVLEIIRESGYSRMPVFKETLDDVRGILYIKDLLPHIDKIKGFRWQSLMRQPIFIPESKKIDELLEEFQKAQVHMAVVIDEYGGTSGIVTLEDILEEIVGDITDEFDEENKYFTRIAENEYIFEGNTLLNDFYKATGTEDHSFDEVKGEAETLAGLILEITRAIPKFHDKIKYKNFTFEVEDVDSRRINKIRVIIVSTIAS